MRRFVVILEDVNSKLAALADALTAMREHLERRLDRLAAFERPFDDLASKLDTKADASSVDPLEARMR